jgi:hypothetical protein
MLEQTAVYQRARTQVQKKGIKEQGKKGGTSSAIGSLQPCERSELPHAAAYPLPTTHYQARSASTKQGSKATLRLYNHPQPFLQQANLHRRAPQPFPVGLQFRSPR